MKNARKNIDQKIAQFPRIASLPKDRRGLPIPFIVLRVDGREPDFTVNDTDLTVRCVTEGRCSICGDLLGTDVWFIGGPISGFDPRGAYRDPPVHHECGTFALQVCPYLAVRAYSGMKPAARDKMLQEIITGGEVAAFVDQTMIAEKPNRFVFAKAAGFHASTSNHHITLLPNRPFIELEEWIDGKLVASARPSDPDYSEKQKSYRKQGLENMKLSRIKFSDLPTTHKHAWLGKFEGKFPWNT